MTTPSAERAAGPGAALHADAYRASISWEWDTPLATGAISICRVLAHGGNAAALDELLRAMTGRVSPAPGAIIHRSLAGIDDGLVARTCDVSALVMPHGGIAIRHALDAWLRRCGAVPRGDQRGCQAGALTREALRAYPEVRSPVEALALSAVADAGSPRAIPLLLAQDLRMSEAAARGWRPVAADEARARRLSRLLRPPLVVAVGAANAGKSSLLNALAGRTVAIAADMPGTTRDCIAGRVLMDGLVVDWLDTPGIRDTDDTIEIQSRAIARSLAQRADLVVGIEAPDAPLPADCSVIVARAPDIILRTKSDVDGSATAHAMGTRTRGIHAESRVVPTHIAVSAHTRTGLDDLALAVRRALVPDADIECADPWIFDPAMA